MQGSAQLIVPNRILLSGCEAGDAVRLRYRLSAVHFGDSLSTRALTFSLVDCGSEGASAVVVSATPVTLEGVIELRTPKDSPTGPAFRVELRLRGRNVAFTEVFALVAPRTSTSLTSTSLTAEMADLTSLASATPFRAGELVDVRIGSEWQAGLVIKCAEDGDVVVFYKDEELFCSPQELRARATASDSERRRLMLERARCERLKAERTPKPQVVRSQLSEFETHIVSDSALSEQEDLEEEDFDTSGYTGETDEKIPFLPPASPKTLPRQVQALDVASSPGTHSEVVPNAEGWELLCDYAAEENAPWQVGDQVEAVWLEDDVFYLATVVNVWNGGKFYDVEFTEYGNLQERTPADCVRPLTDEEDLRSMGLLSEAQTSAHVPDEVWKTIVHAAARDMPKRAVQVGTTLHEHAFDGLRAVKWLLEQSFPQVTTRGEAAALFQRMLQEGVIAPLSPETGNVFSDAVVLYAFRADHPLAQGDDGSLLVAGDNPRSSVVRRETMQSLRRYLSEEIDRDMEDSELLPEDVLMDEGDAQFLLPVEGETTGDLTLMVPEAGSLIEEGNESTFWDQIGRLVHERSKTISQISKEERVSHEESLKSMHGSVVRQTKWVKSSPRVGQAFGDGASVVPPTVAPAAVSATASGASGTRGSVGGAPPPRWEAKTPSVKVAVPKADPRASSSWPSPLPPPKALPAFPTKAQQSPPPAAQVDDMMAQSMVPPSVMAPVPLMVASSESLVLSGGMMDSVDEDAMDLSSGFVPAPQEEAPPKPQWSSSRDSIHRVAAPAVVATPTTSATTAAPPTTPPVETVEDALPQARPVRPASPPFTEAVVPVAAAAPHSAALRRPPSANVGKGLDASALRLVAQLKEIQRDGQEGESTSEPSSPRKSPTAAPPSLHTSAPALSQMPSWRSPRPAANAALHDQLPAAATALSSPSSATAPQKPATRSPGVSPRTAANAAIHDASTAAQLSHRSPVVSPRPSPRSPVASPRVVPAVASPAGPTALPVRGDARPPAREMPTRAVSTSPAPPPTATLPPQPRVLAEPIQSSARVVRPVPVARDDSVRALPAPSPSHSGPRAAPVALHSRLSLTQLPPAAAVRRPSPPNAPPAGRGRGRGRPPAPASPPAATPLPYLGVAIVMQSWHAQRAEQLTVAQGLTVFVLERPSAHWALVSSNGVVGIVPANVLGSFVASTTMHARPQPPRGVSMPPQPVAVGRGAGRGRPRPRP